MEDSIRIHYYTLREWYNQPIIFSRIICNRYIKTLVNDARKSSAHSTTLRIIRLLLLSYIVKRTKSRQKRNIALISTMRQPNPHFQAWVEFRIVYTILHHMTYFLFYNLFFTDAMFRWVLLMNSTISDLYNSDSPR